MKCKLEAKEKWEGNLNKVHIGPFRPGQTHEKETNRTFTFPRDEQQHLPVK
jgi:hypothetical protein